jgi:benzoyl-CoA reductase/2-hydroxyglutaryl-CoA dehydratase subunit BcrC/BadD/HgdB
VVETDEGAVDDMMRDLAGRYLLPSTCPCFSSVDDRLDRILNLIEEFNVDGVVQHGLRLCQLFDMETRRLRETLRQQDIPFLNVQTDYSQEDVEQVRTRIEAFLELLSVRG